MISIIREVNQGVRGGKVSRQKIYMKGKRMEDQANR